MQKTLVGIEAGMRVVAAAFDVEHKVASQLFHSWAVDVEDDAGIERVLFAVEVLRIFDAIQRFQIWQPFLKTVIETDHGIGLRIFIEHRLDAAQQKRVAVDMDNPPILSDAQAVAGAVGFDIQRMKMSKPIKTQDRRPYCRANRRPAEILGDSNASYRQGAWDRRKPTAAPMRRYRQSIAVRRSTPRITLKS